MFGNTVGNRVGEIVGETDGATVGDEVGNRVGDLVGETDGDTVDKIGIVKTNNIKMDEGIPISNINNFRGVTISSIVIGSLFQFEFFSPESLSDCKQAYT